MRLVLDVGLTGRRELVVGPRKKSIEKRAISTPHFKAFRDYFSSNEEYCLGGAEIVECSDSSNEAYNVVCFSLNDCHDDVVGEFCLTLQGDEVIDTRANINFESEGELTKVKYFTYDGGGIETHKVEL